MNHLRKLVFTVLTVLTLNVSGQTFNDAYFITLDIRLSQLKTLLDQCAAKNIPTDYEMVNYRTIKELSQIMKEDVKNGFTLRLEGFDRSFKELFTQAETDLKAYLDGTKTSVYVPRYVTGAMTIDGYSALGQTKAGNIVETRPIFYTGWHTFSRGLRDMTVWTDLGYNIIQQEIGQASVIKRPGSVLGWVIQNNFGFKAEALIDNNEKMNGNYSARLDCDEEPVGNHFFMMSQTVNVKPNTVYYYGMAAKANNANNGWFSVQGWSATTSINGTHNWTNYDKVMRTNVDQAEMTFQIIMDAKNNGLWIDDCYLREGASGENLLKNGDFEEVGELEGDFLVDTSGHLEILRKKLKDAEDANIAMDLLISTLGSFPEFMYDMYEDMRYSGSNTRFNIGHPKTREMIALYIKTIINAVKDFKSLHSICLLNEPSYNVVQIGDYFLSDWRAFLQEKYGSVTSLNQIYGTSYSGFNAVPFPTFDTRNSQFLPTTEFSSQYPVVNYDFMTFNNLVLDGYHKFIGDEVRKWAPDIPLHTKIQQITNEDWSYFRNHVYYGYNYEVLTNYSDLAGNDSWSILQSDVKATTDYYKKLQWYDLLRSVKFTPVFNSEDHVQGDGDVRMIPEFAPKIASDVWQGALHGSTFATIWTWDYGSSPDYPDIYLTAGTKPDAVAKTGRTNLDLNRLANEVTAMQNAQSDVALFYNDISRVYDISFNNVVTQAYTATILGGKKLDFITDNSIDRLDDYKLVILANPGYVKQATVDALLSYMQNGGKLVIMERSGGSALKYDERKQLQDNTKVSTIINGAFQRIQISTSNWSMNSPNSASLRSTFLNIFANAGIQDVQVVDIETGNAVQETEYFGTDYKGNYIINVCSYSFGVTRNVKIKINGEELTQFKDLITGEIFNNIVTLKGFEPRFIVVLNPCTVCGNDPCTCDNGDDPCTVCGNDPCTCDKGNENLTSNDSFFITSTLVYPNPTDGMITLQFEKTSEYVVTISDMSGKLQLRQTIIGHQMKIDIGNYPAGMYLITIDDGKRKSATKIIKD